MARPKGIPCSEEHKKKLSDILKGKMSHPNSLKALSENRYDRTGMESWNKGLKFDYKSRKYNFDRDDIISMIKDKMTLNEISNIYDCSIGALCRFMERYNIKANSSKIMANRPENIIACRERRMKQKFNNKETSIEIKMRKILEVLRIPNTTQKNIIGITLVDFFVEPNICIYCDGDYWHNLDNVKVRDKIINKTLKENGYKVFRFTETQINKETVSTAEMVQEVCYG